MSCRLKRVKLIYAYPYHPIQDKLSHHVIASMDWHSRNLITWNGGQFGYQSMCPNIVCYKSIWIQQCTEDPRVRWNINNIYFTSQTSHWGAMCCLYYCILIHIDFEATLLPHLCHPKLPWTSFGRKLNRLVTGRFVTVPICDRVSICGQKRANLWPIACVPIRDKKKRADLRSYADLWFTENFVYIQIIYQELKNDHYASITFCHFVNPQNLVLGQSVWYTNFTNSVIEHPNTLYS